jgi:hypothetical protein
MSRSRWLLLPVHAMAVFTSAKSFRDNPVIGSAALNRGGLHVMRRRIAYRLGNIRRRKLTGLITEADREAFARDGFVVKPNFLDPETFRAFRAEIVGLEADAREAVIGDALTRLIPLDAVTLRRLPTVRAVLEGRAYRGLLSYIGSFRRRPHLFVQTVFSRVRDSEPDIQSFFHTDTFQPTVKSWFFLEDVGEDAPAFTYSPGSHRLNRRRLAWERRMSITAARGRDRLTSEGSLRISESEITRLGYPPPVRLAVAANTLIVADTSGIHARGVTAHTTMRVSIWGYFRGSPFLPWVGGDLAALPLVRGYVLRIYWAITDPLKVVTRAPRDWRWVGRRSPLTPLPQDISGR